MTSTVLIPLTDEAKRNLPTTSSLFSTVAENEELYRRTEIKVVKTI